MSFEARLMSTYIPDLLTRELDLYAVANPAKWMNLRSLFTGRDPIEAQRMNEKIDTMLEEVFSQIRAIAPHMMHDPIEARAEAYRGVEYFRQMLVRYFENRPELPVVQSESSVPPDPKQVADDFLRSLGWKRST